MNRCPGPQGFLRLPNACLRARCQSLTWPLGSFTQPVFPKQLLQAQSIQAGHTAGREQTITALLGSLACHGSAPQPRPATPSGTWESCSSPCGPSDLGSRHQQPQGQRALTSS